MGLVVLTVVVRIVTEGTVSAIDVTEIIVVAIVFLLFGGLLALWVAPKLFDAIERYARSAGTIVALALAFTLVFAELADAAQLAVVVGAFLAGLALGRHAAGTAHPPRARAGGAPVHPGVLPPDRHRRRRRRSSATSRCCATRRSSSSWRWSGSSSPRSGPPAPGATSCSSASGCSPRRGRADLRHDRLERGVLGDDLYAALLLVVLATTLVTPVLLRCALRATSRACAVADADEPPTRWNPPPGGWIWTRRRRGRAHRIAEPGAHRRGGVRGGTVGRPGRARRRVARLVRRLRSDTLPWTDRTTRAFVDLFAVGTPVVAVPRRARRAASRRARARRRAAGPPRERVRARPARLHRWDDARTPRRAADHRRAGSATGARRRSRIGCWWPGSSSTWSATGRCGDRGHAAARRAAAAGQRRRTRDRPARARARPHVRLARRADGRSEEAVLGLAVRLRNQETARAAYALSLACVATAPRAARSTARGAARAGPAQLRATPGRRRGGDARRPAAGRRLRSSSAAAATRWIETAPREYVVSQQPAVIARHAELLAAWEGRWPPRRRGRRPRPRGRRRGWVRRRRRRRSSRAARAGGGRGSPTADHDVRCAVAATWPGGPVLRVLRDHGARPADDLEGSPRRFVAAVDGPR